MQKNSELYDFIQTLQGQIFYAAFMTNLSDEQRADWGNRPAVMNIKRGYAESPNWVLVQALEFAPEPLTVENFRRRAVYSSPSLTKALLELLASEQYFDRLGDSYYLTPQGQEQADRIKDFRITAFEGFEPVASNKIEKLEGYFARLIEASSQADNPPGRWCIEHSRNRAPADDAPLLAKVIQYGSDFNAFRDDAHMAAFGAHNVLGHVWEAFSCVASEQAQSAAALYEKLAYRGFYTEDWQAALDDLSERGWIMQSGDLYSVTEDGQSIARDVETKTDAYFYTPWDVLTDNDYEELIAIMQEMSEVCQALVAQPAS